MSSEVFQQRIRNLRANRNLSQKQVADGIGITETGYYYYETGRRKPGFDSISALADLYNVSTDYLFGRTNNPEIVR